MTGNGRQHRDIVVAGGSAGSVEAAKRIVGALPADFPAAVLVVTHAPPRERNMLADVLGGAAALPVCQAVEGQPILPSRIYVPAPDRHLVVGRDHLHVTRGPKEGLHRPSINLTFRSAARAYGPGVVGVLLSGMLDDGASGLWEIARHNGVTVVQDPEEALFPSMPVSALRDVPVDYRLPSAEIGPLLNGLVSGGPVPQNEPNLRWRLEPERLSGFTCPECHGPLSEMQARPPEFRCRVGHVFPLKTLVSEHTAAQERKLYEAILALEEGADLAEYAIEHGETTPRDELRNEAAQLRRHAASIRKMLEERVAPPFD